MTFRDEQKARFWVRIIFLILSGLLILVSATSCQFVTVEGLKGAVEAYPEDNIFEEAIEEVIKAKWGWDVDISFWDGVDPF